MENSVNRNSEILFLYDAKRCNPNGDMDNENKPRMDWDTGRNLVSDVRLKRYVRDYLEQCSGSGLFVTDAAKTAEDRVEQIIDRSTTKSNPLSDEELQTILDECMDAKMFGIVCASSGANVHLTGPVQFNWGYSLNRIDELQESRTITSSFSSGEGVGKDYRVNYSFIAFSGAVNARVADETGLTQRDVSSLDRAMIKAIPLNRTRSKIGQTPRLYLRVELTDDQSFLNDLREYISLESSVAESELREISQCTLDASELSDYLQKNEGQINTIHFWKDDKLQIDGWEMTGDTYQPLSV